MSPVFSGLSTLTFMVLLIILITSLRSKEHPGEIEEASILTELTTSDRFNDDEARGRGLQLFSFASIMSATEDFSIENKLGQGGFGPVYKWYMSSEYAMKGIFSEKSDVYSFGVLLLQIVSGRKNSEIFSSEGEECPLNLVGHAWGLWKEGRTTELIDPTLADQYARNQIGRCIHVGLLCIQESASKRPTMSDIIPMITNETLPLPDPKKPVAIFTRQKT